MSDRKEVKEVLLHYHERPYEVPLAERLLLFKKLQQLTKNDEAQKSAEWHLKRSRAIGGSEIKKALKVQGNREYYSMLKEKAGFGSFFGNLFTMFGSIIEESSRRITELLFNTTIYEFTSLPGSIAGTSYSPDGISVIELYDRTFIILWEYKSPFVRAPTRIVPDEYRAQITSGLCHIRLADFGIFTNFAFRLCELDNWDDTLIWNYDLQPVNPKYKLNAPNVLGLGMLVFTHKEVGDYKPKLEKLVEYAERRAGNPEELEERLLMKGEIDYGQIDDQTKLADLFRGVESKEVIVHHLEPHLFLDALKSRDYLQYVLRISSEIRDSTNEVNLAHECLINNMDALRDKIGATETVMGVLPFKLMDLDLIRVNRDPNYMEPFMEGINTFNDIMPLAMELPPEKRLSFIRGKLGIKEPDAEELLF